MGRTTGGPVRSGQEGRGRGARRKGAAVRRIVSVSNSYRPTHHGFRGNRQLECLVSCRTSGQRRGCNADECVYEDSSIVVVIIEHWHASRVMRVRVTCPMHMDCTPVVMIGRVVVWVGVR